MEGHGRQSSSKIWKLEGGNHVSWKTRLDLVILLVKKKWKFRRVEIITVDIVSVTFTTTCINKMFSDPIMAGRSIVAMAILFLGSSELHLDSYRNLLSIYLGGLRSCVILLLLYIKNQTSQGKFFLKLISGS